MKNNSPLNAPLDNTKQEFMGGLEFSTSAQRSAFPLKTLFLTVLAIAMSTSANAATLITSLPYTITQPGNYQLASSLNYPSATGIAITVNSADCTIDLNGFVISGTGIGSAIGISSVNHANVTVRNGTVTRFNVGVALDGDSNPKAPTAAINTSGLVENLRINQVQVSGIRLINSSNAIVRNCQIYSVLYSGPELCAGINSSGGFGNLIANNQICNVLKGAGIFLNGSNNDVVDGNLISRGYLGIVGVPVAGDAKIKNNTTTAITGPVQYDSSLKQLPGTNF